MRTDSLPSSWRFRRLDDLVPEEYPICYGVLKPGNEATPECALEISTAVSDELGKAFRPERIVFVPALPKTRSAKVVRRPKLFVSDVALAAHLQSTTTRSLSRSGATTVGPLLETLAATELIRQRNRLADGMRDTRDLVDRTLAALGPS